MIVSISSSIETFKTVTFHAGLNVLLADIARTSTDKHTRNSAGKTSLVEITHFLLGSSPEKGSLFKKPEIAAQSFTGKFRFGEKPLTVTRKVNDDERLVVDSTEAEAVGLVLRHDDELDLQFLHIDDWKAFLGQTWFSLPRNREGTEFVGAYAPTFRSLIGYFARRRRIGGFSHVDKQNEHQQPWDSQVNLSYLLGLSWDAPRAIQNLRARRATLKSLRKAIRAGELGQMFGTAAEIRPELARAEERIERLKRQVSSFQVLDTFREQADRVASIKNRMSQIAADRALARETVNHLDRAIQDETPPQYADVETLYRAAGVELPSMVLKRFEDVEKFQASVVQNRKRYLQEQMAEATESIDAIRALLQQTQAI